MKIFFYLLFIILFIGGCKTDRKSYLLSPHSQIVGQSVSYSSIEYWSRDDLSNAFVMFKTQCKKTTLPKILDSACIEVNLAKSAVSFFEDNFVPVLLTNDDGESTGLMTGYYEPLLEGSLVKSNNYRYPIYTTPDDLIIVDLVSVNSSLHGKKLRGKIDNGKVVPFYSREEINKNPLDTRVICYVNSDIDRFFLQVQGSGRIKLESGKTIFIGYDNENGHPYRSIGKEMIKRDYISKKNISLESIRQWLEDHPNKRQTILEYNPSFIFFSERDKSATGTLGLELSPLYSIAVDSSRIPLGMPVYYETVDPLSGDKLHNLALAQDTGGAIKGAVRADLFWGFGKEAEERAGAMKSPLKLWVLVPKNLEN